MEIKRAEKADLKEILALQYLAYQSEAKLFSNPDIPPLRQTLDDVLEEYRNGVILKVTDSDNKIIGSVRGYSSDGTAYIGKLIVHPQKQGQGIGTALLQAIEMKYPGQRYELFTSSRSHGNIRLYERLGYRIFDEKKLTEELKFIYLEKLSQTGIRPGELLSIRLAMPQDIQTVCQITHRTISEVYPHYYPGGVVNFFSALHSEQHIREDIMQSGTYLAVYDTVCVGTVTINGTEISRLFVLPPYQHNGYGTALMDFAEQKIFETHAKIELHASLPGKAMYLKRGYREKEYRRKKLENDDWICIDIMEKGKHRADIL